MKEKVLQLLPAPTGLNAIYAYGEGSSKHKPVVCLALKETIFDSGEMVSEVCAMVGGTEEGIVSAEDYGRELVTVDFATGSEGEI